MGRTCFAFQMTVVKNTQLKHAILLLYYCKRAYANALQRYVKRILTLLFLSLHIPVKTSRSGNLAGHFPFPSNNNHQNTTPSRK